MFYQPFRVSYLWDTPTQNKVCRLNRCTKMNQLCVYIYIHIYNIYIYFQYVSIYVVNICGQYIYIIIYICKQYEGDTSRGIGGKDPPPFPSHSKAPNGSSPIWRPEIVTNKQQSNHLLGEPETTIDKTAMFTAYAMAELVDQ